MTMPERYPLLLDTVVYCGAALLIGLYAGCRWFLTDRAPLPEQLDCEPPQPCPERGLAVRQFDGSRVDLLAMNHLLGREYGPGSGFSVDSLHDMLCVDGDRALLAEVDGAVVGLLLYQAEGRDRQILLLLVDRVHRRQGIGTAMLIHLRDGFQPGARVWCMVMECRHELFGLLRSLGFATTKVLPRYPLRRVMTWTARKRGLDSLPALVVAEEVRRRMGIVR